MDFVKRLLIRRPFVSFHDNNKLESQVSTREEEIFRKKNRFYITTFELEFEKNDNKLDSKLFQPRLSQFRFAVIALPAKTHFSA